MRLEHKTTFRLFLLFTLLVLFVYTLAQFSSRHSFTNLKSYTASFEHFRAHPTASSQTEESQVTSQDEPVNPTVDVVVASLRDDNTTWIHDRLPDWRAMIYTVDDVQAPLTVPVNKGQEAMVYLTYIIDNYHQLPEYAIFRHAARYQWHSDDPDYDGLTLLRRLQLPYVKQAGYVNLRCVWAVGCPEQIRPFEDEGSDKPQKETASIYKTAFQELLPGVKVPDLVALSCCGQFAASREAILGRSLAEYQHFRNWIVETELDGHTAGVVFEYLWHIIFGKSAVYCPDAGQCYCNVFGLCELECNRDGCGKQYTLPPSQVMPEGWPRIDWDGSPRQYTEPDW